jgi:hypothetical protein
MGLGSHEDHRSTVRPHCIGSDLQLLKRIVSLASGNQDGRRRNPKAEEHFTPEFPSFQDTYTKSPEHLLIFSLGSSDYYYLWCPSSTVELRSLNLSEGRGTTQDDDCRCRLQSILNHKKRGYPAEEGDIAKGDQSNPG